MDLAAPRPIAKVIPEVQIRFVSNLKRCQLCVGHALQSGGRLLYNVVDVIGLLVCQIEPKCDGCMRRKSIKGLEVGRPKNHGIAYNDPLFNRMGFVFQAIVVEGMIIYHIIPVLLPSRICSGILE